MKKFNLIATGLSTFIVLNSITVVNDNQPISSYPKLATESISELKELSLIKETSVNREIDRTYIEVNSTKQIETEVKVEVPAEPKTASTQQVYLGKFISSSYCTERYHHICNNGDAFTAMGDLPIPLKTVAVDPEIIPLGSKLRIKNDNIDIYVIANDKGAAIKGKKIDIVNKTHQEALEWGKQEVDVWIIK